MREEVWNRMRMGGFQMKGDARPRKSHTAQLPCSNPTRHDLKPQTRLGRRGRSMWEVRPGMVPRPACRYQPPSLDGA